MKKGLFFVVCMLFLGFIFTLSGCNYLYVLSKKVISEYRSCLFYLKSEDVVVTFTSGKRESDFFYDGKHTYMLEYGVVVLKPLSAYDITDKWEYVLLIDSLQYNGILEYNPVDGTFVADIGKEIEEDSDIYIRFWGGGISDQAHMKCVSSGFISYKEAFKVAVNKLGPVIKRYKKGLKIKGEFFIKFVGEESLSNMSYYVQFVGENKENYICLVDVYTGKIKLTKGV